MDGNGEAALTMLTAFIGAVVGTIGCLVGAMKSDPLLTAVAAGGTAICAGIWFWHLSHSETGEFTRLD